MFVIRPEIMIGFSNGCLVLVPKTGVGLPVKYLSEASSWILSSMLDDNQSNNNIMHCIKGEQQGLRDYVVDKEKILAEELEKYIIWKDYNDKRSDVALYLQKSKILVQTHKKPIYKLDQPVKIVLIPTWKCNRNCMYCGVPRIPSNYMEERIDTAILDKRLNQAIDNGLQEVMYHGGEPLFFYPHIFEQISMLTGRGVNVFLSTKNYISSQIAAELSGAGLKVVQLSIDTCDPNLSLQLYRDKNYAIKLMESIRHLYNAGIKVCINTVVSKLNYKGIPELLKFLARFDIHMMVLSRYRKSNVNDGDFSLSQNEQLWLYKEIQKSKVEYKFEEFQINFFDEPILHFGNRPVCEAGRIAMVIVPNGQVCYCDFLCDRMKFCFGNLKTQTIEELWYSKEYNDMVFPEQDLFRNSKCYECEGFFECRERGICYVGKEMYYSEDRRCYECQGGGV